MIPQDLENIIIYDEEYVSPNPSIKDAAVGTLAVSLLLLLVSIFIFSSFNPYSNSLIGSILLMLSFMFGTISIYLFVKYYDET